MHYEDMLYGATQLPPAVADLLHTAPLQRLRGIHQGGAIILANPAINHTRFDHSVGVMLLIRQLGGSLREQLAGLLHDVSHTAFSHLIDYVLELPGEDYHEQRYETVLADSAIQGALARHGFHYREFLDLDEFTLLEQPLPNLAADRIDYTLRDLHQLGVLSPDDVRWFVQGLRVHEGRVVVGSAEHARWFSQQYAYLIEHYFAGPRSQAASRFLRDLIRTYYVAGQLTLDDFHQDDAQLLARLHALSGQPVADLYAAWQQSQPPRPAIALKPRHVDPEILLGNQVIRLSTLDDSPSHP
ncbi:HD domain-containing protein [Hymenobacter sediminis]|uniref:HD domain-containing protein n=1 Tax=Hymenobacter sediminis TaxID=2218621 RepID=UPI000DA6D35A|nr:HD domain-containing protein [Hymenobacter sediminis]RPD44363.1 HD domain-containing protein [Hymenobacter sediminis]